MCRLLLFLVSTSSVFAQPLLVENGQPRAEIIISETPTRMQRVAAHEFRMQIEKISGARLPIVTQPSGQAVKVFIGASKSCPVNAEALKEGAYRIATGADWMALVGDDSDFTITEPFAKHNGDIPRAQEEWHQLTHSTWSLHSAGLYKNRLRLPGDIGKPDGVPTAKNEFLDVWGIDERGSFNAVCGFLQKLGARWYLPGELGEVLPSLKTIELPKLEETVRPDFSLRQFNFRFSIVGWETALWTMRLGMRNDERLMVAHGMDTMTGNDATFAAHPEWFALYGGKRDYRPGDSKNQLCYSNDELFRETVRFARETLDHYPFESVSIMPPDGYTAICQCEKCKGKDSPERNERGLLSDYVWDFVNRVAKEVGKTHPTKKILNCAYGVYTLPPLKIDKLEPNVVVGIVGGRSPVYKGRRKANDESSPEALRAAWAAKSANPIFIFENYPFTDRGWYLPSFVPHALGDTINATKGVSSGEDIWLTVRQDFDKVGIGFNHFQVYFTARAYWGGKAYDADATLREYCRLFYGPAEQQMLAFFNHCEQHYAAMDEDKAKADEALALFEKAKAKVSSGSRETSDALEDSRLPLQTYAARIALIDDYLKGLRMKSQQLGQKRGPVPFVRLVGDAKDVVIDGKLDDEYWQKCPTAATGRLRELQTGRAPTFGTTFKAGWQGNSVCFAVRCDERRGEKLNIAATREDDQAIWYGDAIEIELATETHSYYSIAISPNGHIVDLDRGAPRGQWFGWDSKAEVATHIADDHWTVEIRIPVTQDENDPLHQVIGRKPIQTLPWHINLCRQRIREDGQEHSAFSPTGIEGFHEPMKFAHFYDGRSHVFDADPSVTDFVIGFREASQQRKAAGFLAIAEGKLTDFQKAAALEQAAFYDKANAPAIIERIPIDPVKKAAQMQHLLATFKAPEVIAQFASEDISQWPFWKRGDGFHARGRAYSITKTGDKAEADLKAALEFTSEPRTRDAILLLQGQNRENNLKNDDAALEAYNAIIADRKQIGGADEFGALQGIARVLTRKGRFDEALAVLDRANPDKLQGVWKTNIMKSIEAVKQARK
ncbi:DUF4838 domain-containing protein [Prosthecobacter sp.]|uniref:DUF4838 domain-containing protein n=1 Tax=Prosthecobacter sp. TaxID=1965333 RepID=UPI002ABC5CAE|nr:DUF4838 domain-containing protein [Prosthecobacter sp.]MDZ4402443.1 DUF4838 domain-containing protein [Prosthecobacter sp.]